MNALELDIPPGYEDILFEDEEDVEKGKRPGLLIYTKDILSDMVFNSRTDNAQFLWLKMMLVMDRAEPYGHLANHHEPMTVRELGRIMRWGPKKTQRALDNLEEVHMFSRNDQGVIYSRRMVRDYLILEAKKAANRENGKRGIEGAARGHEGGRGKKKNRLTVVGGSQNARPGNPPGGFTQTPLASSSPSAIAEDNTQTGVSSESEKANAGTQPADRQQQLEEMVEVMVAAGVKDANVSHPMLQKQASEGVTVNEIKSAVTDVDCRDKPMTFPLAIVRNRRNDAAKAPPLPPLPEDAPPAPLVSTTYRDENPGRPPHMEERGKLDALKKRLRAPKPVEKPETAPVDAE